MFPASLPFPFLEHSGVPPPPPGMGGGPSRVWRGLVLQPGLSVQTAESRDNPVPSLFIPPFIPHGSSLVPSGRGEQRVSWMPLESPSSRLRKEGLEAASSQGRPPHHQLCLGRALPAQPRGPGCSSLTGSLLEPLAAGASFPPGTARVGLRDPSVGPLPPALQCCSLGPAGSEFLQLASAHPCEGPWLTHTCLWEEKATEDNFFSLH